jgi:hypothetical protein
LVSKIVKESQETTSILKQLRLLELGYMDTIQSNSKIVELGFPNAKDKPFITQQVKDLHIDTFSLITKIIWKDMAQSCLEELKNLIINDDYKQIFITYKDRRFSNWDFPQEFAGNTEASTRYLQKFVVQFIDFLFQNRLIDEQILRKTLEDNQEMINEMILYTYSEFVEVIRVDIYFKWTQFTEHWYWSHMNQSFSGNSSLLIFFLKFILDTQLV